ncbi:BgTH12-07188 [Blumeria graminis f. sp. triticale]|uniref:BgTH12-07188 n=1 Tax=Blumeria graminis f. sp. triticale TaxID=1689686 RepID=A0A9W4DT97_BLUGR|nr:BgTH12-07188 [Blumeria graminis f. sp. triticale]
MIACSVAPTPLQ